VDPGGQSKKKKSAWSFAPYFEMLLPADQAATLLVIGLALSRYRSVRISQVPSVGSLRWSSLIFPNVQSRSGFRKEHRPSALKKKALSMLLVKPKRPYWKLKCFLLLKN
jgi:hypothetical protein